MELVGLWRYPVKSMQGEELDAAEIVLEGLAGDRRWGVADTASGRVLSAKREGRLLLAAATTSASAATGPVTILLPDGVTYGGPAPGLDAALTSWLGRPVGLVEAGDAVPTFESQSDDADDTSGTLTWQGRPGRFVDSSPVHLLTTASLRAVARQRPELDWARRRFRPNLLIDAPGDERVEDGWVGRRLRVGDVELEVVKPCERCVMTTRPQPGGLARDLGVLRHLTATSRGNLGVLARVHRPGGVAPGAGVAMA